MARSTPNKRRGIRSFILLLVVVLIGAAALQQSGYLETPLQSALMIVNLASGSDNFAMAGEDRLPPPNMSATTTDTDADSDDVAEASVQTASTDDDSDDVAEASVQTASTSSISTSTQATTGTLTLDAFTAELAAAGVDVNTLSATLAEQGRSFDDMLAVVNSGRISVADLAARLNAESSGTATTTTATTTTDAPPERDGDEAGSAGLLSSIRWDEFGSVLYDLWFFLAVTAAVIVIARPIGWLVNHFRPARRPASS
jgi:hypothetical protein